MTVLILAPEQDSHAALVKEALQSRGMPFVQYDFTKFPASSQIGLSINRKDGVRSVLTLGGQTYTLSDFSSVWHRRPGKPQGGSHLDPTFKQYTEAESRMFLEGLLYLIPDAFWFSNPKNERAAEHKQRQLLMAYELGFKVPDTVMGNHAAMGKQCIERHETLAIKPIFNGLMELELTFRQKIAKFFYELKHRGDVQKEPYQSTIAVLTQCFDRNQAQPYVDLLPECPVIVQEYVPKKLELRITVVGDQIFPCAIHSQDSHRENRSDWRNDVYDCRHEPYTLPPDIEAKCFEMVRRLGVHFGCIDLIVTPADEYVFLEINPNGQWRWVQELTGMPIAEAIAELLINRKLL